MRWPNGSRKASVPHEPPPAGRGLLGHLRLPDAAAHRGVSHLAELGTLHAVSAAGAQLAVVRPVPRRPAMARGDVALALHRSCDCGAVADAGRTALVQPGAWPL